MTQEDKDLLLKDLCGRLPYQPICEFTDTEDDFCTATAALGYSLRDFIAGKVLIKPYLRPMESMTEKETYIFRQDILNGVEARCIHSLGSGKYSVAFTEANDWLDKKMFDYRDLIHMGLALEAPEGMYK